MADPPNTRPQQTYRAIASVRPITHIGSHDDCRSWMNAMLGAEVYVIDATGKPQVVGIITDTESRLLP